MQDIIYRIRRHKHLRRFCRLLLNFAILSLLGFLIWFGITLFTGQWVHSSIIGGLIFVGALVGFIWLSRIGLNNTWGPSMKVTVVSLVVLFFIFAYAGVHPINMYKDMLVDKVKEYVVDEVPQYVQSPIETKMRVGTEHGTSLSYLAYRVTIDIIPTTTTKLDTPYKVEVTSPYCDQGYEWDIQWCGTYPEFPCGFYTKERSFLVTDDNPLYDHIDQLEYRKIIQRWGAWTMSEIEAEYQKELSQIFYVRVTR